MRIANLRTFFFDLDGVLTVGKENPRYLGGREVVKAIKSLGKRAFVLTNDSTHVRIKILANLAKLGFNFTLDDILTSSFLTASYLSEKFERVTFFLVGEDGLKRELESAGHHAVEENPQVVVVGFDRKLTYEKLDNARRFLKNGAHLIGSYGGAVYMSANGPALSAGPIIKALEYASGRRALIIGKPSPRMFRLALQQAQERPASAVMVGDQIETDVVGASRAGVHSILVLTGVENRETVARSKTKPDMLLENVDDLSEYLQ